MDAVATMNFSRTNMQQLFEGWYLFDGGVYYHTWPYTPVVGAESE